MTPRIKLNFAILCSFVLMVFNANGDLNPDICPDSKDIDKVTLPPVPSKYYAKVQVDTSPLNLTVNLEYALDTNGNGYISSFHENVTTTVIYDQKRKQLISVVMDKNNPKIQDACIVKPLNSTNGWDVGKTMHKKTSMTGADWYLRYAASDQVKKEEAYELGEDFENGVPVKLYGICMYWKEEDASVYMKVNMSRGHWTPVAGKKVSALPVSLSVKTSIAGKVSEDYVTFYYFDPDFNDKTIFNIPDNVYCYGLNGIGEINIPKLPKSFSYQAEIITKSENNITDFVVYQNHLFDSELNFTRFDYRPIIKHEVIDTQHSHPEGIVTEIHDFWAGVAYNFDETTGSCNITTIPTSADDVKLLNGNKVIISNPMAYLGLKNFNYTYYKEERHRGIDAEQFRTYDEQKKMIHEYWFSSAKENIQESHIWNHRQPMTHIQYSFMNPQWNRTVTNIFNFDIDRPDIFYYDISTCFKSSDKRRYSFQMKGTVEELNIKNFKAFHYFILLAIVQNAMITPLRVTHFEIMSVDDHTNIMFTLLEKVSVKGNGNVNDNELTSEKAMELFSQQINAGNVRIQIPGNITVIADTIPKSLEDVTHAVDKLIHPSEQGGFSGGSMGILAFFMIIGGLLMGGLGAYLYQLKYK